jgi:hypothetical protein
MILIEIEFTGTAFNGFTDVQRALHTLFVYPLKCVKHAECWCK